MTNRHYIYHLVRSADLAAARSRGAYSGSREDRADGFMHFSTAAQVRTSAARHRTGEVGLILLAVDPARIADRLKWEPARGGDLFPHLYGDLGMDEIARLAPLPLGSDGLHQFPDWVASSDPASTKTAGAA